MLGNGKYSYVSNSTEIIWSSLFIDELLHQGKKSANSIRKKNLDGLLIAGREERLINNEDCSRRNYLLVLSQKNNCSVDNLFLSVDTLEKKRSSISSFSIHSLSHVNSYVKSTSAEKNALKTETLWWDAKIQQVHIDSFDTAEIILSSEIKDIVLRSKKYVTRRTTK